MFSNAKVGPVVLIGSSTTIGTGSVIRYSCVGNSCKIGNDVTVVDSQIGNSVIIGVSRYDQFMHAFNAS